MLLIGGGFFKGRHPPVVRLGGLGVTGRHELGQTWYNVESSGLVGTVPFGSDLVFLGCRQPLRVRPNPESRLGCCWGRGGAHVTSWAGGRGSRPLAVTPVHSRDPGFPWQSGGGGAGALPGSPPTSYPTPARLWPPRRCGAAQPRTSSSQDKVGSRLYPRGPLDTRPPGSAQGPGGGLLCFLQLPPSRPPLLPLWPPVLTS